MNFSRRHLLLAGAALALPLRARAAASAVSLTGSPVQGGLVMGHCPPGSKAWVDGKETRVADGLFCFGFGRDADKPAIVNVALPDGGEETNGITPGKRNFVIQRINGLPEEYVSPPKDILERIGREAKAVVAARAHDTDELWFAAPFAWPADGPISSIYGSQRILNGEPREAHYGVDIAAPEGTPIHAPVDGIVRLADFLFLSGNTAVIDHGHGVSTSYLHMSRMDVKPGDRLKKGDRVGLIGHTGRATGPHLCWRMNWFQTRLDVALLVPPRPGDRV